MFKIGDMVKMTPSSYLYDKNESAIGYIVKISNKTHAFPIKVTFITQLITETDYPEQTWVFKSSELKKIA